jgi:hypothetical protein
MTPKPTDAESRLRRNGTALIGERFKPGTAEHEAACRMLEGYLAARRARAREAKAGARLAGKPVNGQCPLGFKLIGPRGRRRRVPDLKERRQMAAILRYRLEGCTWDEIYFHFLQHKVKVKKPGKKPREWSRTRLQRALLAELQLQMQEARGQGNAPHPPG